MSGDLPLAGVTVLSLAEQYPGPYATLVLADLGADVILVERPGSGDPSRRFPAFFESLNRNKRSIALDLKGEKGRTAFLELAANADVVMEGYRPGTVDRLGVGYDQVRGVNPRLVYVSVSGFGQDGPYRDLPAHDVSYQAVAGMLFERLRGEAGTPSGVMVADLSSAMFAIVAVLTGLLSREDTGEGTYVDVSMTDGLVSWMTTHLVPVLNRSGPPGLPSEPGYGLFRTADGGLVALSVAHEDRFWARLCRVTGLQDLADLPGPQRRQRHEELSARVAEAIAKRNRDTWETVLFDAGVPFGPVLALDEVPDDPHVRARGLVVETPGAEGKPARRHIRQPLRIRGTQTTVRHHAPGLGEHTREVLEAAGYDDEAVEQLLGDATRTSHRERGK